MNTDKLLIEALERCATASGCRNCEYADSTDCAGELAALALNLINRQKAEIERLYKSLNLTQQEQYTNGRNDGIKEFAKRLKETKIKPEFPWDDFYDFYVTAIAIDTLVKEMTGEDNDTIL